MSKTTLKKQFGRHVRRLREAAGHTQEAFARRVKLDRAYYGRVERGRANVTLATIETVAKGLGVEPWELLRFARPKRA